MTTGEFSAGEKNPAMLRRTDAEHRDFARQLAAEKARLVAAQAVAKVGSWENDLVTSTVTWSDETHRIFGTTADTFSPSHQGFLALVHPDDRAIVSDAYTVSMGKPGTHAIEHRVMLPNGGIRFVEERWAAIFDERGTAVRSVGTSQDITERTLVERALRESEERFASAFEQAPIGVALVSPEGRWLMVNQALCSILGYARIDLLTRSIQDVTHPDDIALSRDNVRRAIAGEFQTMHFSKRYVHALGHAITATVTSSLVRDANGAPRYFVSHVEDVTESERVEQALRQSEEKFRTLAEAIPHMIWIARPDGTNSYMSPLWLSYTGLTREESGGDGWQKPFHPEDLQRVLDAGSEARATNGVFAVEYRLRRADGEYRWWMNRGVPRRDDNGAVLEWIGSCTDIHDLKQAQLEFRRVNRALRLVVEASTAVINSKSEAVLLAEICRIAVEVGEYAMGWIGFAADDEAKSINPMACVGTGDGYLSAPKATWDANAPSGQGPAGRAIRTGEAVVSDGFGLDATLEPWREGATRRGYAGVIALPLRNAQRAYGALVLCSTAFGPPTDEELDLLKKVADGVAFGINKLRARTARPKR